MFWRILKKDLKRKKTMNIVLLLFIIMCSMFAAASVNNIIAVTGGIEHYFDKAEVPEIIVSIQSYTPNDAEEQIRALPSVKDVRAEHYLIVMNAKSFKLRGEKLTNFINPTLLVSDAEVGIRCFNTANEVIERVPEGSFYASGSFLKDLDIQEGEEVELTVGDTVMKLRFAGRFKGAVYDSSNSGSTNTYLLINSKDYARLDKEEAVHMMIPTQLYIKGGDQKEIEALAKNYDGVSVNTRDDYKSRYLYDMIAAYIMMIISVLLLVTAFVVLRFSIGFTITEEFREIGVMKAVGIGNGSIRWLYIVKYMALAVIGAVIGFLGSLPLTDMMLTAVSENMVLGSEHSDFMGLLSVIGVVAVILLFCYMSTRRVKKLSPIDAVRSGQTGERFGKRSILHLGGSKLPATGFLAVNDVLSAPKQFSIITVVFALCLLMITTMSTFSLTLQDDSIYPFFDIPKSDASIVDTAYCSGIFTDLSNAEPLIADTEQLLRDNGMPGTCTITSYIRANACKDDQQAEITFAKMYGNTNETFTVDEGSAPQKSDEILMTVSAMNDLGVGIGDHIKADIGGRTYEFIITGRHSTFQSHAAFLYKDFDLDGIPTYGFVGLQIRFNGDPDKAQIDRNIAKLKDLIDSENVYTTSGMIKSFTGISDTLDAIKYMMIVLTVIVTAMIGVLMERSFISKEKSEIALMKAVGVSSSSIILQHALRFVIVSLIACAVSSLLLLPVSNVLMNQICLLIGDISGLKCILNPFEVFLSAPALIICVTVCGVLLTALYTRTIKASDTASIE